MKDLIDNLTAVGLVPIVLETKEDFKTFLKGKAGPTAEPEDEAAVAQRGYALELSSDPRAEDELCCCSSYSFPHVAGDNNCRGTPSPDAPSPFCETCGKSDPGEIVDFGIGPYEFWGRRGFDSRPEWVSTCCEATLFADRQMQREADPPEGAENDEY